MLHDQLLVAFAADPTLQPQDVIVGGNFVDRRVDVDGGGIVDGRIAV